MLFWLASLVAARTCDRLPMLQIVLPPIGCYNTMYSRLRSPAACLQQQQSTSSVQQSSSSSSSSSGKRPLATLVVAMACCQLLVAFVVGVVGCRFFWLFDRSAEILVVGCCRRKRAALFLSMLLGFFLQFRIGFFRLFLGSTNWGLLTIVGAPHPQARIELFQLFCL